MDNKVIEIIGGGTVSHVRNHLALAAIAYGTTARTISSILDSTPEIAGWYKSSDSFRVRLHLTKMANNGKGNLETNEDVEALVDQLIEDERTKIIFFNPALCDFDGSIATSGEVGYEWSDEIKTTSGKYAERLKTSAGERKMILTPSAKIVSKIRKQRKDIFLVAFKTTCGATEDEQFLTGLHLLKTSSCNLVLANDTKTRKNMVITPEQARYHVTTDRDTALKGLVEMALSRAKGTFTRSTVVEGKPVPWDSITVPHALLRVVNHCIAEGAYKPFNGATVGHFAFKPISDEGRFITSRRKSNFNELEKAGMVLCQSNGDNEVIAHGSKPSVGGQSQRIIFREHPEMDCIVHFHCPPKSDAVLSVKSQREFECGSHQCGQNTSNGLKEEVPGIKCVYLDNHGPNIVFNRNINPQQVIDFIDAHFDLRKSTDGVDRSKEVF